MATYETSILSHLGLKRSDETKRKISIALTGKHLSETTKQKLREINTGKKQSAETLKKRMVNNYKPIIQMSLDGKIIREWKSATDAEKNGGFDRNCISRCMSGTRHHHKKYLWKHKNI